MHIFFSYKHGHKLIFTTFNKIFITTINTNSDTNNESIAKKSM